MGGKRTNHLRKLLQHFKAVQNWQLILILIPLCFVAATLLRLDHLRMTELRTAVFEADQSGDQAALETSMADLQKFVTTHIVVNVIESNGVQKLTFGTGPFYLEQQYLRTTNAIIEQSEAKLVDDSNPNGNIYAAVSNICRPLAIQNGWAWNSPGYLECWTSELAKYPASEELDTQLTVDLPSTEEFRRNFASPVWAPTWAGWVLLACVIIFVIVVVRILIWFILQIALIFAKKR